MARFFALAALCATLGFGMAAGAGAASGDSRRLTQSERTTFIALVCRGSVATKDGYRCTKLFDYPGPSSFTSQDTLTLSTIAYGAFTVPGVTQAYVSYSGSFEPHANNFGGGMLFTRSGGTWKLVQWYPGRQLDDCIGLPSKGRQRMLCLSGYTGMGETSSTVAVEALPATGTQRSTTVLLRAVDTRGVATDSTGWDCSKHVARDAAVLLAIDGLHPSKDRRYIATASVGYAPASEVRRACARSGGALRPINGLVRFKMAGGTVQVVSPLHFLSNDE